MVFKKCYLCFIFDPLFNKKLRKNEFLKIFFNFDFNFSFEDRCN